MSKGKETKFNSAIEAVEAATNGREAVGAYIEYFRSHIGTKLDFIFSDDESGQPYLNHATRDQLDTLAQLTEAMEQTLAVNIAGIRKQDALAEEQARSH